MTTLTVTDVADAERQIRQHVTDLFRQAETRAMLLGGEEFDPDVYDAAVAASHQACEAVIVEALALLRRELAEEETRDQ